MFISKKDLENLETKIMAELDRKLDRKFEGKIIEWNNNLQETLKNWELKPRQKTKKVVD